MVGEVGQVSGQTCQRFNNAYTLLRQPIQLVHQRVQLQFIEDYHQGLMGERAFAIGCLLSATSYETIKLGPG